MSGGHIIRFEFDNGYIRAEAFCREEDGADCRLTGACDCEEWGRIERRDDGTIWHLLTDGYRDLTLPRKEEQWHEVKPADYCNVCLFINESGCPEELAHGVDVQFNLADVPFKPYWDGDAMLWERIT